MVYDSQLVEWQLLELKYMLQQIFKNNLISIYLYGSFIVGGLQRYSDLDVFVLLNNPATKEEKTKLTAGLLKISGKYMKDIKPPLEVTIVAQREVNPWRYPPRLDFQYGEWLREKFESGIDEPWQTKATPDLAIIITQMLLASQTLYGPEADKVLDRVPYRDFFTALTHSLEGLIIDLFSDTRNVLLTLVRIWHTLETDLITSKPAASEWANSRLPEKMRPVIDRARAICLGVENEGWEDLQPLILPCATFILDCINDQISRMKTANITDRVIKLAS